LLRPFLALNIALVLTSLAQTSANCAGTEPLQALDDAELDRVIDQSSHHPEIDKRGYLATKYLTKGRDAMAAKEWQNALTYLLYAEKMAPNALNTREISLCLAELGRSTEALWYLKKHNGDKDVTTKIAVLIRLGRKQEALKLCQTLQFTPWDPSQILIKVQFLDRLNQHGLALKEAQDAYIHGTRQAQEVESIAKYLKSVGVKIPGPEETKRSSKDNEKVLALIKQIAKSEPPPQTSRGLEAIFHQPFNLSGRSNRTVVELSSDYRSTAPLTHINYDFSQRNSPGKIGLITSVNPDTTAISEEDVEKLAATIGGQKKPVSSNLSEDKILLYTTPFGEIFFVFSPKTSHYLGGVSITWNDQTSHRQPAKAQENSRAYTQTLNSEIENDIAAGHFKRALPKLFQQITARMNEEQLAPIDRYRLTLHRKNQIATCYKGLRRDDIVEYLNRVPVEILYNDVLWATTENRDLQTINEYLKQWNASGNADGQEHPCYQITIPGNGNAMLVVCESSPRYPEFVKLLGKIQNTGDGKNIFPLPAALMDAEQLDLPLDQVKAWRDASQ